MVGYQSGYFQFPISLAAILSWLKNLQTSKWFATERFERLDELFIAYDNLSGPQRKESLIEFLGKFAHTDNIPELKNTEFEQNSEPESSSSNESE